MAIKLLVPRDNAKITNSIIAGGRKAENDPRPTGVLIGLHGKDGALDENRVVGGTTVVLRGKDGKEIKDRWAIHFDLKTAQKGEYYRLRLYNPVEIGATNHGRGGLFDSELGCTNLQVGDPTPRVEVAERRRANSPHPEAANEIDYPTAQSHPPANDVVATGQLPDGDYDVDYDPTRTYIYCATCDGGNPSTTDLYFAFIDSGDYTAYFNPVVNGSGKAVTLRITYLDSGRYDEVSFTLS